MKKLLAVLAFSALTSLSALALGVGDKAPELKTGDWIQGPAVTKFETGKVYVVEFWASWCAPCVQNIPHLNELQKKYEKDGLVVIGQNVWERSEAAARKLVRSMGSKMSYRVALDTKSEDMSEKWMKAAGKGGIPTAFLVDKTGKIAWIGHPSRLDGELKQQFSK